MHVEAETSGRQSVLVSPPEYPTPLQSITGVWTWVKKKTAAWRQGRQAGVYLQFRFIHLWNAFTVCCLPHMIMEAVWLGTCGIFTFVPAYKPVAPDGKLKFISNQSTALEGSLQSINNCASFCLHCVSILVCPVFMQHTIAWLRCIEVHNHWMFDTATEQERLPRCSPRSQQGEVCLPEQFSWNANVPSANSEVWLGLDASGIPWSGQGTAKDRALGYSTCDWSDGWKGVTVHHANLDWPIWR